ncbi:unnamed protein product [Thlaspi arvense]|uniref:Glutathione hydrolase n=1 Tax=Thlaspi arvense TaxID=13288 RepID=A0AAU9SXH4_THLAR|nr:unnamed protein product [Thlaspi arvense]
MSLVRTAAIALLLIAFLQNAAAQKRQQSIVKYRGAVATDDGRCSEIGMSILRQGGNAIDASVAAALCLGVVSPASSGIGGGAFTVVKIAGGKAIAYDSRETAPLRATEDMYGGNLALKQKGALSVGVPGEVSGLFTAWKQHGKLPWKRLVRPAEKLAKGFRISKYLYMQMNATRADILADKGLSELFVSNGELKKAGTICRNPKLALTLRQIAKYGAKAFYNGTVGINLARDIRKSGGIITLKDLQSYRVTVKKPLSGHILGYQLLGMPPPSSGGAAMMLVLNILSQYEIPSGVSGPLGVHRLIEALKHAFAVRMNLGDPDFVDVTKVVSDMLSPKFAKDLKSKINDDKTFDPKYYGGMWNQIDDHGTSHLSIIDRERNAVSMTSTINGYFGALMLSPSTGIVLNNEMDDFSIPMKSSSNLNVPPPAPANFIRPGKRPLSSMTPTIVLKDGQVKAAVGASGGANIIAGTTEVFLNHFFLKMDPLSSVLAPRIYHQRLIYSSERKRTSSESGIQINSMSLIRTATIALFLIAFLQNAAAENKQQSIATYHGAVATDDGRCSEIGMNALRQGGNAVDASVAAALCLGVVSSASSGIGGGAFIVVKIADGKEIAYDCRETAPLRATENMYDGNLDLKKKGALSVAVPGEVAGLFTAWTQHGKLPWKQLVYPAQKLAAQGFKISKYLYMQMNHTKDDILADKGLSELFVSKGELKIPGTIISNPKLAFTLSQIAEYGPKAFYNGTVGNNLVSDIQKSGGIITLKDLQDYKVKVKEPLSTDIVGYRLLGMPPPSSGGPAMVLVLNILSQYGIPSGVSGPLGVHRLVEALKHAFAIRMNLGDPDFVDVTKVVSDMLSPKFAQDLKSKINDEKTFDPKYYGAKWNEINDHGTSHLSIIDSERNAVSMTSTINSYFGAVMLSPSTGIVLNNEMDDFSIPMKSGGNLDVPPPAPANFIRSGKRPLSSMTPAIVLKDGKVKAAVGASGGMYIIAATSEVFLNHFFLNMDPLSSVMAPRIYHQLIPNQISYENWTTVYDDHFEIPKETRDVLEKKGHVLTPIAGGTISQFIIEESGGHSNGKSMLVAVSDPRKGGFPSGY